MENLIGFLSFSDPNTVWVLVAVTGMCVSAAVVGVFSFLRKQSLIGDAVAHAILPGICIAFLITGTKNPLVLLLGAFLSGWFGLININAITKYTKLKSDAALALVLSVFYGIGILLLTVIQNSGNASQSGLDKFLFGKAAAMVREDVFIFTGLSILVIVTVLIFYQPFRLLVFDKEFAVTKGIPVKRLEFLLSVLTVFTIALGIQAVGVVLMAALLIAPAAAARYWTDKLTLMLILSGVFAMLSGFAGTFVSYSVPKMPTGPWIVSILALFAVLSVLFGRKNGALANYLLMRRNKRKILHENILKCLFHLSEKDRQPYAFRTLEEIQHKRAFVPQKLRRGIRNLSATRLIEEGPEGVRLTESGHSEGKRVTRLHRLWELYLTTYLKMASDHVHENAEAIEHIITPEIEKELESRLAFPNIDPHHTPIPR